MLKPDSLRAFLVAALPELGAEPDRLQIFVDKGQVCATGAAGLGFEYRYTLNLILLDFAADPGAVFIPLLVWLGRHQPEVLQAWHTSKQGVGFEVDVLSPAKVDLSIELPLSERVGATEREGGGYDVVHFPEPVYDSWTEFYADGAQADVSARLLQLYLNDELLVQFTAP